jgi:hypothetical protein
VKNIFIVVISFLFIGASVVEGQDLLNTRIRMIKGRKRAIYFDQGIFHSDGNKRQLTSLVKIRNAYVKSRGYERIVFEFSGQEVPAVYGSISSKNKKINLDFFNTSLKKGIESVSANKYLKSVNFYLIDSDVLSVEISFKHAIVSDIFYLKNPARLVIDVKK